MYPFLLLTCFLGITLAQECTTETLWTVAKNNKTFIAIDSDIDTVTVPVDLTVNGNSHFNHLSLSRYYTAAEAIQQGTYDFIGNLQGDVVGILDGRAVKGFGPRIFSDNQVLITNETMPPNCMQMISFADQFVALAVANKVIRVWTGNVDDSSLVMQISSPYFVNSAIILDSAVLLKLDSATGKFLIYAYQGTTNNTVLIVGQVVGMSLSLGNITYGVPVGNYAVLSPNKVVGGYLQGNASFLIPITISQLEATPETPGISAT